MLQLRSLNRHRTIARQHTTYKTHTLPALIPLLPMYPAQSIILNRPHFGRVALTRLYAWTRPATADRPRYPLRGLLLLALLLTIVCTQIANANPLGEIRNLIQSGKPDQALSHIAKLPGSLSHGMEATLLKAEALSAQGKHTAAEILLHELIQRMPERPEPYNNLAVVLARQGDILAAQEALEKGMNANPAYAALYRNLTQIFVDKARDAYSKALQLGENHRQSPLNPLLASPRPGQSKRAQAALATNTTPNIGANIAASPTASQAAATSTTQHQVVALNTHPQTDPSPVEASDEAAAQADDKPVTAVSTSRPSVPPSGPPATDRALSDIEDARTPMNLADMKLDTGDESEPAPRPSSNPAASTNAANETATDSATPAASASPAATKPVSAETASSPALSEAQQAVKAVLGWARAWSQQSPKGYLSSYSQRYTPPRGMSREAWQAQRQQRILNPEWIKVTLSEFKVTLVDDDTLNIDFKQQYRSNRFNSTVRKRMTLVRETGDDKSWRILRERVTSREIIE